MAVMIIGCPTTGTCKDYCGLSTDTKPLDCGSGSTFLELDTSNVFMFDGINKWWPL